MPRPLEQLRRRRVRRRGHVAFAVDVARRAHHLGREPRRARRAAHAPGLLGGFLDFDEHSTRTSTSTSTSTIERDVVPLVRLGDDVHGVRRLGFQHVAVVRRDAALGRPQPEQVREPAAGRDRVQRRGPLLLPLLRQGAAVVAAADDLHARPERRVPAVEGRVGVPRGQDEDVEWVLGAVGGDEAFLRGRFNTPPVRVDQVHVRLVERLEVRVAEGRALAPYWIPRCGVS